jgi:hypothetical protein
MALRHEGFQLGQASQASKEGEEKALQLVNPP